jgi:hypothetical protein
MSSIQFFKCNYEFEEQRVVVFNSFIHWSLWLIGIYITGLTSYIFYEISIASSLAVNHFLTVTIQLNDFTREFTHASSTTILIPPDNRTCIAAELLLRGTSLPHIPQTSISIYALRYTQGPTDSYGLVTLQKAPHTSLSLLCACSIWQVCMWHCSS